MLKRGFILSLVLGMLLGTGAASAQWTEIIDATGDGTGNTLNQPNSIAVDASGNVYLTGSATNNAFKITPGGTITEIIDATGDGTGNTLTSPRGIGVDGAGNVYVAGTAGGPAANVFKIAAPGTCSTGGTPCTITEIIDETGDGAGNTFGISGPIRADASGNVFVVSGFPSSVFKIAAPGTCSTGGTPCTITELIDSTGDGTGNTLTSTSALAVDAAGNVYLGAVGTDNVFKIATPGTCSTVGTPCTITEIMDSTGDGLGNTFDGPQGDMAVDSAGNVYVAGVSSNNGFKIAMPGTCSTGGTPCIITEIIDSTGDGTNSLSFANGVAADTAGNVYVTGASSSNAFQIATPGTCSTGGTPCTITQIIDSTGDGMGNTLVSAGYIAVDTSGNAFVTGLNNAFKMGGVFTGVPAASTVGLAVLVLAALVLLTAMARRRAVA